MTRVCLAATLRWTSHDPAITAALARLGRSGVLTPTLVIAVDEH